MKLTELTIHIEFVYRHSTEKKRHPGSGRRRVPVLLKTVLYKLSLHWHVALDAVGKHNHSFGAHNAWYFLHAAVEQLHEVFIVV